MMQTARPKVKRTYSRLKRETSENNDSTEDYKESNCNRSSSSSNSNIINSSITSIEADVVSMTCDLDIVKVDKMRKITDFFKVKRETFVTSSHKSANNDTKITYNNYNNDNNDNNITDYTLSSPLTSVSNKFKQTYLDLGQKNLISVQCPDCLMHYNKSFPDDINLHKKFHMNYLKGFNFNLKIDEENVMEMAPKDLMKWSKFRFYEIKKFDSKLMKKFEFFMNFVHVQLGAEPLTVEEMKEDFDGIVVVEHLTNKILAFGLFEKCSKVFKSLKNCDHSSIQLETDQVTCDNFDFIGVSRIWTDERHRSMGLARTLLDLKCKGQRERVAFSQPTPAGFAFAKSYQKSLLKGNQCFIYLK